MVNEIEELVKAEIYKEVLDENPNFWKNNDGEYFRLCIRKFDKERHLRIEARERMIGNRYSLKSLFYNWVQKISLDYEFLNSIEQRLKDRMVLEKIVHFFCNKSEMGDYKNRMIISAYKIYWRKVKDKRKSFGVV